MILSEETKMSISDLTNPTWRPSQHACKARRRRGHILLSTTGPSTTLSKNTRITGVSNLSKNCTSGISTGTSSNCGTSTVVCTVTTRHQPLNNNGCYNLSKNCICVVFEVVQHSTNSEDRRRRGQGRRSIFPNRLTTAGLRLPRQPATANGATTPGISGPLPFAHRGLWCHAPFLIDAVHAGSRVTRLVTVRPRSLRDASLGSESSPPGRFSGRRPCARSAIARGRWLLTHSPRREVVSGPAQLEVPTPRHLGVEKEWR